MRRLLHLKSKKHLLAAPYAAWAVIFIVVPLCMILYYGLTDKSGAFTLKNILAIATPGHARALWRSILLSLISTVLCFLLAYPLAMILAEKKGNSHGFIILIFILPMWMNFLLRTLAWQTLLEKTGVINGILAFLGLPALRIINTSYAIVLGMVYNFLPFMVLPIYNSLEKIDRNIVNAARDLGANPQQVFMKITLPLTVPGIISGIFMVFLPSMTNYVVLDMLYNSTYIMGSLIGAYFAAYDWHGGSMISLVLLMIILVFTLFTNRYADEDAGNGRGGVVSR